MASDPAPTFAEVFEQLRQDRGWSPAEVARRLGVYPTEVSRWRHGRGGISITNVRKVADLFGVDRTTMERLAGYGDSNVNDTLATVDAERQSWGAWFQHLMDTQIPRSTWTAYTKACLAMAEVFKANDPSQLNMDNQGSLNKSPRNSDKGSEDDDMGDLLERYQPQRRTYQNTSVSLLPA